MNHRCKFLDFFSGFGEDAKIGDFQKSQVFTKSQCHSHRVLPPKIEIIWTDYADLSQITRKSGLCWEFTKNDERWLIFKIGFIFILTFWYVDYLYIRLQIITFLLPWSWKSTIWRRNVLILFDYINRNHVEWSFQFMMFLFARLDLGANKPIFEFWRGLIT